MLIAQASRRIGRTTHHFVLYQVSDHFTHATRDHIGRVGQPDCALCVFADLWIRHALISLCLHGFVAEPPGDHSVNLVHSQAIIGCLEADMLVGVKQPLVVDALIEVISLDGLRAGRHRFAFDLQHSGRRQTRDLTLHVLIARAPTARLNPCGDSLETGPRASSTSSSTTTSGANSSSTGSRTSTTSTRAPAPPAPEHRQLPGPTEQRQRPWRLPVLVR